MTKEMVVWKKGKGTYKVSSESQEGLYYRVREVRGVWVCTCPHFTQKHNIDECKHIQRVREALTQQEGIIDETPLKQLQDELTDIQSRLNNTIDRIARIREGGKPSPSPFLNRESIAQSWGDENENLQEA